MRVVEGAEWRLLLALQRSCHATAKLQPLDSVANDLLEPAIAGRPADAVLLSDDIDEQRGHLVALAAVADHGEPDADVESVQPSFRPGDRNPEIIGSPRLQKLMRHLAGTRIRKDLGQGDDPRLAGVGGVGAIEIALQFVEAVRGEQLDEIGGNVAQGPSQDRAGA